jgi:hypothetical protein
MPKVLQRLVGEPPLLERIDALHAEIEELIDREVERQKEPGVPHTVYRGLILARCHGFCRCMVARQLDKQ